MHGDIARPRQTVPARSDGFDTARRQPAQFYREQDDQHQRQPEARHRIEHQRADRQEAVAETARPRPRDNAEQGAGGEGKCCGRAHQQKRVGQAFQHHAENGPRQADRPAEIAMRQRPEIGGEPVPDRLVQPPSRAHGGDLSRIAAEGDGIGVHRVAGGGFQHHEAADHDDQQHHGAARKALAQKGEAPAGEKVAHGRYVPKCSNV